MSHLLSEFPKGFKIRRDYYNGENYALCLNIAASIESDPEEKTFYRVSAKKARQEIIEILDYLSNDEEKSQSINKWPYATLANCYFGLSDDKNGTQYEEIYLELASVDWERETYFESKDALKKLLKDE